MNDDRERWRISVSFEIIGGGQTGTPPFDPSDITASLSIIPSISWKAGDLRLVGGRRLRTPSATSGWVLEAPAEGGNLSVQIEWILDRIAPAGRSLRRILEKQRASIELVAYVDEDRRGPMSTINPVLLERIADLGIQVGLDVQCVGGRRSRARPSVERK